MTTNFYRHIYSIHSSIHNYVPSCWSLGETYWFVNRVTVNFATLIAGPITLLHIVTAGRSYDFQIRPEI